MVIGARSPDGAGHESAGRELSLPQSLALTWRIVLAHHRSCRVERHGDGGESDCPTSDQEHCVVSDRD